MEKSPLSVTHPELAKEADGWDPSGVTYGSKKKMLWLCSHGHSYLSTVQNRTLRKDGCPFCSGRKCLTGFNDLATTDPDLASEAFGWDPTTISRGSGKKLAWKCHSNHTWIAKPNSRTSMENGCPGCEETGFNPDRNAWFYLIEHQEWEMLQIGITNSPKSRLAKHRQHGWTQIDLLGPIEGRRAKSIETEALKFLKSRKVKFANKAGGKKFDGWTEAWSKSTFDVASIKDLVQQTEGIENYSEN